MIERGLAVLSGVDTRLAAKLSPQLTSMAIDSAYVSIGSSPDHDYFSRLVQRTLTVASRQLKRTDVRLSAILVSFVEPGQQLQLESTSFFPALRRKQIETSLRADLNRASMIANTIKDAFRSEDHLAFVKSASFNQDARYTLPLRNAKCKPLTSNFWAVYNGLGGGLTRRIDRYVVKQKRKPGYRIADLAFEPALNDGTHPVRRCTNSPLCDLQATFRFGLAVPERFEFDVSGENGIRGKSFLLCNGVSHSVSREASHLNMRINDDFREG